MIDRRITAVLGLAGVGLVLSCASPEEADETTVSSVVHAIPPEAPVSEAPVKAAPVPEAVPAPTSNPVSAPPPAPPPAPKPRVVPGIPTDDPSGTALIIEPRVESWPVAALAERASEAARVRIAVDVANPFVQAARVHVTGRDAIPAGGVLPWLQSVLRYSKLTLLADPDSEAPWTVSAIDRLGQTEDRPGHVAPRPVTVAPRALAQLESREGLFVSTTFPLAPGVDPAHVVRAFQSMSTFRLGRIAPQASPPALVCSDFAPTLAGMWRLMGQAGLLTADATPLPAAPKKLEAREHVVLLMPQPEGPVTIPDLLDWAGEGADLSFYYDPRNHSIRNRTVEFVGETQIWRRRMIPWLRSLLRADSLVILPLGPEGRHGQQRWTVVDLANPVVKSHPLVVAEEEVGDLARFGGAYVGTVLQLPDGLDVPRVRAAILQTGTTFAGLGSVFQAPGRNALVVRDFAATAATMHELVREIVSTGAVPPPPAAVPGSATAEAAAAAEELVSLRDPEFLHGYTTRELLHWGSETAGLTFQFAPGNRAIQNAQVSLAGDPVLRRADVLPWVGALLRVCNLALVPLQTDDGRAGAHAPNRHRFWNVVNTAHALTRAVPSHTPGLTREATALLPDCYAVGAPRLADAESAAAVRRAFTHLRTRTAALGRMIEVPGTGRVLVGDMSGTAVRIVDALGVAGLLAEEPRRTSRLDVSVGRDVQTGRRVGISLGAWRLEQLLPSIAESTGFRFAWAFGQNSPHKRVQIDFESPKQTAPAHEVLRLLQNALLEKRLVMVPLLAPPRGKIGAMWGIVDQANPLVASHALPVAAAEIPWLARWEGLYVTTALPLKPGVDSKALRAQLARRSTQFAGLGSVHEVPGLSLLVITDFASVVAKIRADVVREDALR